MGEQKNMALLSQNEIDTLIAFLNREKEKSVVESEVLSQESIDKLIDLIQSNQGIKSDELQFQMALAGDVLALFYVTQDTTYQRGLKYELIVETGEQMKLYAKNPESGAQIVLLPEYLQDLNYTGESCGWGICLMPAVFRQVAEKMELAYGADTWEQVQKHFAKTMYGREDVKIPTIYL